LKNIGWGEAERRKNANRQQTPGGGTSPAISRQDGVRKQPEKGKQGKNKKKKGAALTPIAEGRELGDYHKNTVKGKGGSAINTSQGGPLKTK